MTLVSVNHSYDGTGGLKFDRNSYKNISNFSLDAMRDMIENYEETTKDTISSEEFYRLQEEDAKKYLAICDEIIQQVESDQKRLKKSESLISRSCDGLFLSISSNQSVIASLVDSFRYGANPNLERILGVTWEEWNQLDYEAQCQLVIEKTDEGKECHDKIVKTQKLIDDVVVKETNGEFKTYEEYMTRLQEYEQDLTMLKASRYAIEQEQKEYPYKALAASDEFLQYVKDWQKSPPVADTSRLYEDRAGFYSGVVNEVALMNTLADSPTKYKATLLAKDIRYDLLEEQDKMMYCYLYEKEGRAAAKEYLKAIEDRLNKKEALQEKDEFIKMIMDENGNIPTNVGSILLSGGKGFVDGVENWCDGIVNIFNTEGIMSTNQYAQIYILDELERNYGLKLGYESGVAIGNTTPSLVASGIVSVVGTPAAGKVVGIALLGASAGGNAKNQALVDGNDLVSSTFYGGIVGLSTSTLSYAIGKIPGLSMKAGFSLKNAALGGLNRSALGVVKAGAKAVLLGESVDLSGLTAETINSFLVGALTTATMNGVDQILHLNVEGTNIDVSVQKILKFVENHKDCQLVEALKAAVPVIYGDALSGLAAMGATTPDFTQVVNHPINHPTYDNDNNHHYNGMSVM